MKTHSVPATAASLVLILSSLLFLANCDGPARPLPVTNHENHAALSATQLGAATHFAVLAGSAVTNTGSSTIEGNLGLYPGLAGSLTGFPPGAITLGTIHAGDAFALQAQTDLTATYVTLAGLPCDADLTGKDLGGMTLTPGVYCFSSSAGLTGVLQLDAQGVADAVFVFQVGSTLTTASDSVVKLLNNATPCNVSWQVGSSATLGTRTTMVGHIVALSSITLTTGASLMGNALARNGAVTLDTNDVNQSGCLDTMRNHNGDGGSNDAGSFACTLCGGSLCVDLSSDGNNCGSCGTLCPSDLSYCVGGSCSTTCE